MHAHNSRSIDDSSGSVRSLYFTGPHIMNSVCVFCGSAAGTSPVFRDLAEQLGTELAQRKLRLVYGGGRVGLMGVVADAVLAAGGEAIGFMPRSLAEKEIAHVGLTELHVNETMHERKAAMEQHADAFIALPGGFGTLDELCEILTWSTLGIHRKPVGLLDVDGFFAQLTAFFDHATETGFIRPEYRGLVLEDVSPAGLLDQMASWQPTVAPKWTTLTEAPRP